MRRMDSIWRSRRRLVSSSANTPSMDNSERPTAELVSMGCSVAFSDALLFKNAHDDHQIGDRAGDPINARDTERVAFPQEIEQRLKLSAVLKGGAAPPLGAADGASCGADGFNLNLQAHRRGARIRAAGIAVGRHRAVSDGCDSILPR